MKASVILLLIGVLISWACGTGKKDVQVSASTEIHITVPEKVELYNPFSSDSLQNPAQSTTPFRIYTMIDVSCATCLMKVRKWNAFRDEFGLQNDVTIIPICITKDNFEMLKYMVETDTLQKNRITFLLDTGHTFITQNNTLISPNGDMTVLTDNKNNVLLKGSPLDNNRDKEEFKKKITAMKQTLSSNN